MSDLDAERFCYVATTGRRSGNLHTIEIWYVATGNTVYILAGGGERSDTVRNARAQPRCAVRIGARTYDAIARVLDDAADPEAVRARELIPRKYAHEEEGLVEWALEALPVAFDLTV